jgi:hypothetical protein
MDKAVAEAWGQGEWADYSRVSRTLAGTNLEEANQLNKILDKVSQPFIQKEVTSQPWPQKSTGGPRTRAVHN